MATLVTASGKEFECDYFNASEDTGQINLRILNTPIEVVATVFTNSAETKAMTCEEQYASMFVNLVAIVPESDAIRVVIGR